MQFTDQEDTPMGPRRPAQRRLFTVPQFCQDNPAFNIGGMRWLLFHRDTNGLAKAVVKVGRRRILIDEDLFVEWLDDQNEREEGR